MNNWNNCKNILCIRADNMGDLVMSTPAIAALKKTFDCKITLLTSKAGSLIVPFLHNIDHLIIQDLPWSQNTDSLSGEDLHLLVETLRKLHFDAAVIFTVNSQNPLPAAMLAYMAGIPLRLAYCRENPYLLLTDWVPDQEPFSFIRHQVERDIELVASVGAVIDKSANKLSVTFGSTAKFKALAKLNKFKVFDNSWIVFHPGVSEQKRSFDTSIWIQAGKLIRKHLAMDIFVTGSLGEKALANEIADGIGFGAYSMAGVFSLEEWISIIDGAQLVVSVNTSTVHIAAATQTPVVVLYALTNPQHTPWKVPSKILPFSVKQHLRSKNTVVKHVAENWMPTDVPTPTAQDIFNAVKQLLLSVNNVETSSMHIMEK